MKRSCLIAVVSLVSTLTSQAILPPATELITNGDFETGNFTGWTTNDLVGGVGAWGVDPVGADTFISMQPTALNPSGGLFYAVSDQTGPGTHALSQTFTVPGPASSVMLSFDMFVNDWDTGPIIDPIGLDHRGPANQHARVDILVAGSDPFDTTLGVLSNLYIGTDPDPDPNPYTSYLFDITGVVGAGGTFTLRFAETDNQLFFNQGVDNVSIQFTPIPEPAGITLMALASLVLIFGRRSHATVK